MITQKFVRVRVNVEEKREKKEKTQTGGEKKKNISRTYKLFSIESIDWSVDCRRRFSKRKKKTKKKKPFQHTHRDIFNLKRLRVSTREASRSFKN